VTLYAFVFSLLLAAAFKDDTAQVVSSEFWSELSWHPIVVFLKTNFQLLAFLNVVIGAILVIKERSPVLMKTTYLLVLILMYVFAISRAVFADVDHATKLSVTICILIWIWIVVGKSKVLYGVEAAVILTERAVFAFAIFFVALNMVNFASGYGYVPGNPRFFGTSGHPNFIGVQLALCNLLMLFKLPKLDGFLKRSFALTILVFGLYLMMITGSRTAALMFISGSIVIYGVGVGGVSLLRRVAASLFLTLVLIYSVVGLVSIDGLDMYSRGADTTDTRTEAWASMLDDVSDNPWIGKGVPSGKSENSYLKASKEYGVFYGLILAVLVLSKIRMLYRLTNEYIGSIHYKGWLAVMVALAIGGCFEAYLDDSFSLPLIIFCLVLSIPTVRRTSVSP
jgi:hypothetical protein